MSLRITTTALAFGILAFIILAGVALPDEPPRPTDSAPSPDYVIGPGDVLNVYVWRNPDLSVTVPVRPDGKITTPLVEDMAAAGKTAARLADDIEKVLVE